MLHQCNTKQNHTQLFTGSVQLEASWMKLGGVDLKTKCLEHLRVKSLSLKADHHLLFGNTFDLVQVTQIICN